MATDSSEAPVRTAVDRFLSSARCRNPNTRRAYVAALDRLAERLGAGRRVDEIVQLLHRGDVRHGHQVATPEPSNFALDAALLMGAVLAGDAEEAVEALDAALLMGAVVAGDAEEAVEAVVRAQGYEALGLLAVPAPQHPDHGGLQVVVADSETGNAAEVLEGADMAVEEHLLGLVQVDAVEALGPRPTAA